jgi:hypothetical protein
LAEVLGLETDDLEKGGARLVHIGIRGGDAGPVIGLLSDEEVCRSDTERGHDGVEFAAGLTVNEG